MNEVKKEMQFKIFIILNFWTVLDEIIKCTMSDVIIVIEDENLYVALS